MRLHVVYDDQGTILAAAEVPGEDQVEKQRQPAPSMRHVSEFDEPVPEPGEHAAEFDVPTEFAEQRLLELLPRLRVDVKENRLVEMS